MAVLFPIVRLAYVNEDHPMIDKLLKDALATGAIKQFRGYQADPKEVVASGSVRGLGTRLQLKGIKYSNITDIPDKSATILAACSLFRTMSGCQRAGPTVRHWQNVLFGFGTPKDWH